MDMPSITILAIGVAVVAIAAAMLWFVSGEALKVASTSQELLELFEDSATPPCIKAMPSAPEAAPLGAKFDRQRAPMPVSRTAPAPQVRHRWAQT